MKKFMLLTVCFMASVAIGFFANANYCANASPENPIAVVETAPEIPAPEVATPEPVTEVEVIEPAPAEVTETSKAPVPAETTDVTEAKEVQEKDTPFFTFGVVWGLLWFFFTVLMLVACVRSELDTANKLIWVMLILLTGGMGTLIYCILFLGKLPKNLFNTKDGVLGLGEGFEICMDDKRVKSLGVCEGLAKYVGWKPEYMRTLMVVLALFEWEILLAYGIFYYVLATAAKKE